MVLNSDLFMIYVVKMISLLCYDMTRVCAVLDVYISVNRYDDEVYGLIDRLNFLKIGRQII